MVFSFDMSTQEAVEGLLGLMGDISQVIGKNAVVATDMMISQFDAIFGGKGSNVTTDDIVNGTIGRDDIYGGLGVDSLFGGAGNDRIFGGAGVVSPSDVADLIYGGLGEDVLYGNGGADILYGGSGTADSLDSSDYLFGGIGSDMLYGNSGADYLFGGGSSYDPSDSADSIYGGLGADYILGNGGADLLVGGADNDTMNGGLGSDIFLFTGADGSDLIKNFEGVGSAVGDIIRVNALINGLGMLAVDDLLSRLTYHDNNATLDLGSSHVTIENVAAGSLTADDFQIV